MNSKSVAFLLVSIIILHLSRNPQRIDCADLEEVGESDQEFRSMPEANIISYVIDSLMQDTLGLNPDASRDPDDYVEPTMDFLNQNEVKTGFNEFVSDSLLSLQRKNDHSNTKTMLKALRNYDSYDVETQGCIIDALIVFVHTPRELIEETKVLIESSTDISPTSNYNHIMWHLNGRKDD